MHPHAIYAKTARKTLPAEGAHQDWEQTLRLATAEELLQRPIGHVALDRDVALQGHPINENVNVGNLFAKDPIEGYSEVSSLNVDETYQNLRIARNLIHRVSADVLLAGWTPMAFAANESAQKAFMRAGYRLAEENELPNAMQPNNPKASAYILDADSDTAVRLTENYVATGIYEHREAGEDLSGMFEEWRAANETSRQDA